MSKLVEKAHEVVEFTTLAYAVFMAIVFTSSWLLADRVRLRLWLLLGASYFFYAQWNWRFLALIFASSSADWLLAAAIARAPSERRRKQLLLLTVVMNLGVLGFFKYYNFGVSELSALLTSVGFHPPDLLLRITLPIGISFFTFESVGYVIGGCRRGLPPHPS